MKRPKTVPVGNNTESGRGSNIYLERKKEKAEQFKDKEKKKRGAPPGRPLIKRELHAKEDPHQKKEGVPAATNEEKSIWKKENALLQREGGPPTKEGKELPVGYHNQRKAQVEATVIKVKNHGGEEPEPRNRKRSKEGN